MLDEGAKEDKDTMLPELARMMTRSSCPISFKKHLARPSFASETFHNSASPRLVHYT